MANSTYQDTPNITKSVFYLHGMKALRWNVFFFCLLGIEHSIAQTFNFETLTTRNGLSSNEILCIYEDQQHFIWIGTRDGLNRFDGRKFQVFRNNPDDRNSISGNIVVDIIQDGLG